MPKRQGLTEACSAAHAEREPEIRLLREKNSLLEENLTLLKNNAKLQEECVRLLEKENEKLKNYLAEVGSLLDNNIVEDNQDPPVTTIYADAFDKITNNECL